jgi:exosortase F-associated protein
MVVYFVFKNKAWTVQAIILMGIVFAITLPIYLYCIHTKFEIGYLFSFYMRRFVIQPLILLVIIPLFYYRKKTMTDRL